MNNTYLLALFGGALIGIAATLLLLVNGRLMGVSGILAQLIAPADKHRAWRACFLAGTVIAALLIPALSGLAIPLKDNPSALLALLGGALVGAGTWIGSGCTSGHGICGLGRLSPRSLIATLTFMSTGILTVWVMRTLHGD